MKKEERISNIWGHTEEEHPTKARQQSQLANVVEATIPTSDILLPATQ